MGRTHDSLTTHKKLVHEGVKYSCSQCDHQFKNQGYLEGHKLSVHMKNIQ